MDRDNPSLKSLILNADRVIAYEDDASLPGNEID